MDISRAMYLELGIMAKVKYYAKEKTNIGTHNWYAVPVPNGTLTFDELCLEAYENTSIEPSLKRAMVTEYMKVVKRNVLKGFRVPVGEQSLMVYPNLNASVKDTKNPDGTVKDVATAKMVNVMKGKSYMVGCDGYYRMLFLFRQDGKIRCS